MKSYLPVFSALSILLSWSNVQAEEWNGLIVAPEDRCSEYDRRDYPYPQSVELDIIERDGLVSLYTGRVFASRDSSDIEHIVALSEAHDSGLCAAPDSTKRAFSRDLLNLALASPQLNRFEKRDKDAADWLPDQNQCWFVQTIIAVKRKYMLAVDEAERDALESVLSECNATGKSLNSWGRVKATIHPRRPDSN